MKKIRIKLNFWFAPNQVLNKKIFDGSKAEGWFRVWVVVVTF